MPEISVVIITFNEEKNIARCLDSVKGIADDIVVVDSFSTDRTEEICKKYPVNFIRRAWEGYSVTKNYGNEQAKFDLILSLDADEALSPELQGSILKYKQQNENTFCSFNRLTNYCGTWIRHCGWYPDVKLRIFDRRKAKWEGSIHEKVVFNEGIKVLHLKGDCLHYSYYSLEDHYRQVEKFTNIASQELFEKGESVSALKLLISPGIKFFRDYVFKMGFLDGAAGLRISRISAYATFLKYKKLQALWIGKK